MPEPETLDDATLLVRFRQAAIPRPIWTHRAHVRIAYLYIQTYGFDDAVSRIGEGIRILNAANGVEEGPTSGYNETTTRAFLHLVAATIGAYGGVMPTANSDEFCDMHTQLMNRNVLRLFYSPNRRMDSRAKTEFVEPDLAPLPKILG